MCFITASFPPQLQFHTEKLSTLQEDCSKVKCRRA